MDIDSDIDASIVPSLTKITEAFESLFIKFTIQGVQYHAGSIYRPPNKSISEFITGIDTILNIIPQTNCIIGGDLTLIY